VINVDGTVITLAGSVQGNRDGGIADALFNGPTGIATSFDGRRIYVADTSNTTIRLISLATNLVSTVAGTATPGFLDAVGTAAQFNFPIGIALDAAGYVYVADDTNQRIRKITP